MNIIAAVQMNSGEHAKENLKSAEKLIQQALIAYKCDTPLVNYN